MAARDFRAHSTTTTPTSSADIRSRDHRFAVLVTCAVLLLLLVPTGTSSKDEGDFPFPALLHLVEQLPESSDKFVHAFLFAIETHWLHRAFRHSFAERTPVIGALVAAAVATLGVGLGSELLQSLVPSRSADPLDLLADGVGASLWLIGFLVALRFRTDPAESRAPLDRPSSRP